MCPENSGKVIGTAFLRERTRLDPGGEGSWRDGLRCDIFKLYTREFRFLECGMSNRDRPGPVTQPVPTCPAGNRKGRLFGDTLPSSPESRLSGDVHPQGSGEGDEPVARQPLSLSRPRQKAGSGELVPGALTHSPAWGHRLRACVRPRPLVGKRGGFGLANGKGERRHQPPWWPWTHSSPCRAAGRAGAGAQPFPGGGNSSWKHGPGEGGCASGLLPGRLAAGRPGAEAAGTGTRSVYTC